jgi:hypothetical protein
VQELSIINPPKHPIGYLLIFHVVQIAELENFFALVRKLIDCIVNLFPQFPVFDLADHFVVVRLIKLCTPPIYLFNAVGQQNLTQKYVAKVMNELYKNEPAGLCGNEDCGQMSAWYVFSAMGFYPVNPVSGKYEIGTPLFPEMKLSCRTGRKSG